MQREAHAADVVDRPMMRTGDAAGSRLGDRRAIASSLGVDPSTDAIPRFDDGDAATATLELACRRETRESGAHNQD